MSKIPYLRTDSIAETVRKNKLNIQDMYYVENISKIEVETPTGIFTLKEIPLENQLASIDFIKSLIAGGGVVSGTVINNGELVPTAKAVYADFNSLNQFLIKTLDYTQADPNQAINKEMLNDKLKVEKQDNLYEKYEVIHTFTQKGETFQIPDVTTKSNKFSLVMSGGRGAQDFTLHPIDQYIYINGGLLGNDKKAIELRIASNGLLTLEDNPFPVNCVLLRKTI